MAIMKKHHCYIVGLRGYHAYRGVWRVVVGDEVVLVREPENPYDDMAIAGRVNETVVGHLPRDVSKIIAPLIDSGRAELSATIRDRPRGANARVGWARRYPSQSRFP